MISWPLVKYVLKAAIRDRLVLSLLLALIVGTSIAVFLGASAVTESDQFAAVFLAAGLRLVGVLGLVLFAVFYVRRAFDSKDVEYLLSRPLSRASFILSHALGFSLLAIGVGGFIALILAGVAPYLIGNSYYLWSLSLMAEFIIIMNAALFFSMVLVNATSAALAVYGLYILARLMGQMLGIVDAGIAAEVYSGLGVVFEFVSLIVPRLDLMAQSSWLVYGTGDVGYGFILLQTVVYTALLILCAMVDLVRRQF